MTPAQLRIIEWLANGATGTSSETMAFWLGFGVRKHDGLHPHDPGDLNRCIGLLERAPELRPFVLRMGELSAQWARLAAHWDELEALLRAEAALGPTAPRCAARMRELLGEGRCH